MSSELNACPGFAIRLFLPILIVLFCMASCNETLEEDEETTDRVLLSGQIVFEDYSEGLLIVLMSSNQEETSGDLGVALLEEPDEYQVEIQCNIGKTYLSCFNDLNDNFELDPDEPAGVYEDNPVTVGEQDITELDIVLELPEQ